MERWKNPCTWGERLDFGHLGGCSTGGDPDSWCPELWDYLIDLFQVQSFLDVGCGVGHAQRYFMEQGIATLGVDCPQVLAHHIGGPTQPHDFTLGPLSILGADLVWSCEVGEHIEERHVLNYVETLVAATNKALAFCAAPPGCGGHHHVNCQSPEWWIERIPLHHDPELSQMARDLCKPALGRGPRNYFRRSGLIFTKP